MQVSFDAVQKLTQDRSFTHDFGNRFLKNKWDPHTKIMQKPLLEIAIMVALVNVQAGYLNG